jgi:hypothetical protein
LHQVGDLFELNVKLRCQKFNPVRQREEEGCEYRGGKRKGTWVDEKEEYMKIMWNYEK